jgi:hypothetical protein
LSITVVEQRQSECGTGRSSSYDSGAFANFV